MSENKIEEVDILNFALNMEYLEAEFYTYATTGKSITSFGIATKGCANGGNPANGGTTKGGAKVMLFQRGIYPSRYCGTDRCRRTRSRSAAARRTRLFCGCDAQH